MINVLTKCPVCAHQLKAVKLHCQSCGTQIENTFDFPKLLQLSKEQLEFVEVFILSRGNIKDVEKTLNISYPTVRAKLDQVIEVISDGKDSSTQATAADKKKRISNTEKQQLLDLLESGEITAEEALKKLKDIE